MPETFPRQPVQPASSLINGPLSSPKLVTLREVAFSAVLEYKCSPKWNFRSARVTARSLSQRSSLSSLLRRVKERGLKTPPSARRIMFES